jgi:hypothetical protein
VSEKVLFFSPHDAIWVHAFPEALVADSVRTAGAELVYITCDGALASFCIPMAARGLRIDSAPDDKARVCTECRRNRDLIREKFGFRSYDFDSVLDADDETRIAGIVDKVNRKDLAAWAIDGVELGRAALYEYLLQNKKLALTDDAWQAFRPRLANVLRSFFAAQRILDRERPTRVVAYNTLYSVNAVWRAVADQRKIPVYFLHAGGSLKNRLQTMTVGRDSTIRWARRLVEAWPEHREHPCHPEELSSVTDHFTELFRGTNVFAYSAPKSRQPDELRRKLGIGAEQKLVVAILSSYDEYVAARAIGEFPDESTLLFASQIDWVKSLVEWFQSRPDLFLLVRVHPREFPNKREGAKSEHARLLERELASLPPNVRVNWPADKLSLYDIAEHASVFLNAWSTAGKEMALLGLPVVAYGPQLLFYPPDLNYVGASRESFFTAIERALADGWSFERIRMTFRWCVLEYVRAVVDISDGFDFSEAPAASLWQRARNLFFLVPGTRQHRDLALRPSVLHEQERLAQSILSDCDLPRASAVDAGSEAAETAALRVEIRRLMRALYGDLDAAVAPGSLRQRLDTASRG